MSMRYPRRSAQYTYNNDDSEAEETLSQDTKNAKKKPTKPAQNPLADMNQNFTQEQLSLLFLKILEQIKIKDSYQFFQEPVDTNLITEYLSIIKQPMDFHTIKNNIKLNVYTSLMQFNNDLLLIWNNAKTFNASDTIYYKEAVKLHRFALKFIKKEFDDVEKKSKFQPTIVNKQRPRYKKSTQTYYLEEFMRSRILPDGSMPSETLSTVPSERSMHLLPKSLFQEMLSKYSSNYLYNAEMEDPRKFNAVHLSSGPYPSVDNQHPIVTKTTTEPFISGDMIGESYFASLENYSKGLPDSLQIRITNILNSLSGGAKGLVNEVKTLQEMKDNDLNVPYIVQTTFGDLDLNKLILESGMQEERITKVAELELWAKEIIDIGHLLKPVLENIDNEPILQCKTKTSQDLCEENKQDFCELLKLKEGGNEDEKEEELIITERIRFRLLNLVEKNPDFFTAARTVSE